LNPEDIPRLEDGPMPSNRMTLQFLEPPNADLIQPKDAVFQHARHYRDGNAPPPALLLDFMYGAAAYKRWGNGSEMKRVIDDKFLDDYQSIPILEKPADPSSGEDSESEFDDPTDGDYIDPGFESRRHRTRSRQPGDPNDVDPELAFQSNRAHSLSEDRDANAVLPGSACRRSRIHSRHPRNPYPVDPGFASRSHRPRDPDDVDPESMIEAMDNMNALMMYMHGVTPEESAMQRQKEAEEKERKAGEFSQNKVLEWMK
jgi:hypothetical protein